MVDIREGIAKIVAKLRGIARRVSAPLRDRLTILTEALTSLVEAIESGAISASDAKEALEKLLAALDDLLIAIDRAANTAADDDVARRLADVENILTDLGVTQPSPPGHD